MIIALSSLHYSVDGRVVQRKKHIIMESEQETSSIFSKLNVNAVEFVPSFSTTPAATMNPETDDDSDTQKASVEQPRNNGTCKFPNFTIACVKKSATQRDAKRDENLHNEVTHKKKLIFLPHRTSSSSLCES